MSARSGSTAGAGLLRRLGVSAEAVTAFCKKWNVVELSLFGSVLRDGFRPDSDVDVMVTFSPGSCWRFYELADMKAELEQMLGHKVDLVEKRVVQQSPNYLRRTHILEHAETVYVA